MSFLANLVGIGRVKVVDDKGDLQLMQVEEGAEGKGFAKRITDKVRRFGQFGFASVSPVDAEVLLLRRHADRAQSIAIATNHRESRPKDMKPGDTVVYDVRGAKVQLTEDGLLIDCAGLPARIANATTVSIEGSDKVHIEAPTIELEGETISITATNKVHIEAPTIELQGNVTGSGTLVAEGDVTARHGGTAVSVGALRDAYQAHKHGGVDTGGGTSGVSDHLV
jgi:phage baseplate assembly protein V